MLWLHVRDMGLYLILQFDLHVDLSLIERALYDFASPALFEPPA